MSSFFCVSNKQSRHTFFNGRRRAPTAITFIKFHFIGSTNASVCVCNIWCKLLIFCQKFIVRVWCWTYYFIAAQFVVYTLCQSFKISCLVSNKICPRCRLRRRDRRRRPIFSLLHSLPTTRKKCWKTLRSPNGRRRRSRHHFHLRPRQMLLFARKVQAGNVVRDSRQITMISCIIPVFMTTTTKRRRNDRPVRTAYYLLTTWRQKKILWFRLRLRRLPRRRLIHRRRCYLRRRSINLLLRHEYSCLLKIVRNRLMLSWLAMVVSVVAYPSVILCG